jgi:type IV pilus assembly protein PilB
VRRICKACRKEFDPGPEVLAQLGLTAAEVAGRRFAYGEGCAECGRTGYRGRVALFEFLIITDRLRKAILENWPQGKLRELATEEGMTNLRQAGVARVFEGVTTVEEIVRETFLEL